MSCRLASNLSTPQSPRITLPCCCIIFYVINSKIVEVFIKVELVSSEKNSTVCYQQFSTVCSNKECIARRIKRGIKVRLYLRNQRQARRQWNCSLYYVKL